MKNSILAADGPSVFNLRESAFIGGYRFCSNLLDI